MTEKTTNMLDKSEQLKAKWKKKGEQWGKNASWAIAGSLVTAGLLFGLFFGAVREHIGSMPTGWFESGYRVGWNDGVMDYMKKRDPGYANSHAAIVAKVEKLQREHLKKADQWMKEAGSSESIRLLRQDTRREMILKMLPD